MTPQEQIRIACTEKVASVIDRFQDGTPRLFKLNGKTYNWDGLPRFTTSLDACKDLIKKMREAGDTGYP